MTKKLRLSSDNKVFVGVCGGIAEYFHIDPTLIRVIWVLLTFLFLMTPIILYIICWVVMPMRDSQE